MTNSNLQEEAFRLKGRLFTLTVLELYPVKLQTLQNQIESVYEKAPNMFSSAPIILDLKPLKGVAFDLSGTVELLRSYKMVPFAVQHASVIQQKAAAAAGLAVMSAKDGNEAKPLTQALEQADKGAVVTNSIKHRSVKTTPAVTPSTQTEQSVPEEAARYVSKVISTPVRSGQQIYAKGGDLIVLASVGTGAELLADGHIHVYGTLRGRALAGVQGDKSARIFCSDLQAELLSIAGQYMMPETTHVRSGAKQICLEDERLKIISL